MSQVPRTTTHLGEPAAAAAVLGAIETVLEQGGDTLTPDMGGSGTTVQLGAAITHAVTVTSPALAG